MGLLFRIAKKVAPADFHPEIDAVGDKIGLRRRRARYAGTRYHCPCCDGRFSEFLPFGVARATRQGAMCPACGSLERHRMLTLYLRRRTKLLEVPTSLLHFAPERRIANWLKGHSNINYVSTDLFSPEAAVRSDITDLLFRDATFDAVICFHVLEHIPDDHKAMTELLRVLRPGGEALIQVPLYPDQEETFEDPTVTDPRERERIFDQSDHVRRYGRDFPRKLERAGFEVEWVEADSYCTPEEIALHGLTRDTWVAHCRRPR